MIRLGKDKVDERFNILVDGTIVDLNGNVQELNFQQGRYHFKKIGVHRIQMWTNYGWRDGHKWAIHHLDKNKLNNSLSNLVYLTRSEHTILHHKGKNVSCDTRSKLSTSLKGRIGYWKGRHHSDETLKKLSIANIGKHLSDETKRKISAIHKGKQLSEEHKARLSIGHKGLNTWTKNLIWVNNGSENKRVYSNDIPDGFVKGKLLKK